MAINNWRVYTFKDLDPMIDEMKTIDVNIGKTTSKMMKDTHTDPQLEWYAYSAYYPSNPHTKPGPIQIMQNVDYIKSVGDEKKLDNQLKKKDKKINEYKAEMDRRNAIINRMKYLRGIMRSRYNSDAKNRLAWANMVRKSIEEYKELSKEANKFMKYIKY